MPQSFFIDPTMGRGNALSGLADTIRQNRERKDALARADAEKAEKQARRQTAFSKFAELRDSGADAGAYNELAMRFPEIREGINQQLGIDKDKNQQLEQRQKQEAKDFTLGLLTASPQDVPAMYESRINKLSEEGRDPSDTERSYQTYMQGGESAEAEMRANEILYASLSSQQEFKAYKGDQTKFEQGAGVMQGFTFNPSTGAFTADPAMIERLQKDAEQKAKTEGILKGKDLDGVNKEVTKLIRPAKDIYESAKSLDALMERGTPAAQLAAVFKFMKANDPTSTVRESEQGQVYGAQGAMKGFANKINALSGKGGLSKEGFSDLVNTAKQLANSAISSSSETVNGYLGVLDENLTNKNMTQLLGRVPDSFEIEAAKVNPNPPAQTQEKPKVKEGDKVINAQGQVLELRGGQWVAE